MRPGAAFLGTAMLLCVAAKPASAEMVDRVAVVVGTEAIKQSDILTEIRVTDFLNGATLDLSLPAQKEAASRLIDQKVIRKAIESGIYPAPSPAEADRVLEQVRKRFPNDAAFRRELASFGISEDVLTQHMLWQLAALRFIGIRFQAAGTQEADGSRADAVNEQFFAWLDQKRKEVRIDFKQEELR